VDEFEFEFYTSHGNSKGEPVCEASELGMAVSCMSTQEVLCKKDFHSAIRMVTRWNRLREFSNIVAVASPSYSKDGCILCLTHCEQRSECEA
jgi:hypothetical protein